MRAVIHATHKVTEDQVAALMRTFGYRRTDAIRSLVSRTYRDVLLQHPHVDPEALLMDLTDDGTTVRWDLHIGDHVPSVLRQQHNRRYRVKPWLALGGGA